MHENKSIYCLELETNALLLNENQGRKNQMHISFFFFIIYIKQDVCVQFWKWLVQFLNSMLNILQCCH